MWGTRSVGWRSPRVLGVLFAFVSLGVVIVVAHLLDRPLYSISTEPVPFVSERLLQSVVLKLWVGHAASRADVNLQLVSAAHVCSQDSLSHPLEPHHVHVKALVFVALSRELLAPSQTQI